MGGMNSFSYDDETDPFEKLKKQVSAQAAQGALAAPSPDGAASPAKPSAPGVMGGPSDDAMATFQRTGGAGGAGAERVPAADASTTSVAGGAAGATAPSAPSISPSGQTDAPSIMQWLKQFGGAGMDPSAVNDPNYWVGIINQHGGLTPENAGYFADRIRNPNQNRGEGQSAMPTALGSGAPGAASLPWQLGSPTAMAEGAAGAMAPQGPVPPSPAPPNPEDDLANGGSSSPLGKVRRKINSYA